MTKLLATAAVALALTTSIANAGNVLGVIPGQAQVNGYTVFPDFEHGAAPTQFAGNPVLGGTNGLQTDKVYAAPTQFAGNPVLGGSNSGRLPNFDTGTAFAEAE